MTIVYPDRIQLEYKDKSYTELEQLGVLGEEDVQPNSQIVHPDGDYLYVVRRDFGGGESELRIYDISDRSAPTFVTSILSDGFNNLPGFPIGLEFDASGRYLYVSDGDTSLYTYDTDDPENLTLEDTLTVSSGGINGVHLLNRIDDRLFLFANLSFQEISITDPVNPTVDATIAVSTDTSGSSRFVFRGVITPDEDYIWYPNEGPPVDNTGRIGVIDISTPGSPAEETPVLLPTIDGVQDGYVSGIVFDPSVDDELVWMILVNQQNPLVYYWAVYKKGATWAVPTLISDTEDTSGEIIPQKSVFRRRIIGMYRGFIVTIHISNYQTYFEYWRINSEDMDPIPRLEKGASGILGDSSIGYIAGAQIPTLNYNDEFLSLLATSFSTSIPSVIIFTPNYIEITDNDWVDISDCVRGTGKAIQWNYGIQGSKLTDRLARQGSLTFTLNNHDPVGLFTPGHTNVSSGWQSGAVVRFSIYDNQGTPQRHTIFMGRITKIKLSADVSSDNKFVDITCDDFMSVLVKAVLKGIDVRLDTNATEIVRFILEESGFSTLYPEYGQGLDETEDIYPFALDGLDDTSVNPTREIQRTLDSERGYFYPAYRHSSLPTDGGFRLESRTTRENSPNNNFVVSDYTNDVIPDYNEDNVYNRVQTEYHQRIVDDLPTTIVYTHRSTPFIQAVVFSGGTPSNAIEFDAKLKDPDEEADRFSATSIQIPIIGTDIKLNSKKDGTGIDLSSNALIFEFKVTGNSVHVKLNSLVSAYLTLFQIKGRGIYEYDPLTVVRQDQLSIAQHGLNDLKFDLPLVVESSMAEHIANEIIQKYTQPKTVILSAKFSANFNQSVLDAALTYDIGDKILVENEDLGLVNVDTPWVIGTSQLGVDNQISNSETIYVIHQIKGTYQSGVWNVVWGLFPRILFCD